jgi:HSF-type DNA-binding
MDDASMGERSGGATSIDTISHPPGKSVSFPVKLLIMLNTLEAQGKRDVISWMPHGRGFIVHQQEAFATEIIPQFFRHSKFSSFQRQLHMYSFQRIPKGSDKGVYYHPNFLRGQPESCQQMIRTRVNGNGCRKVTNPFSERKRWIMSPSPPVLPSGAVVEIPLSSVMIPLAST